MKSLDFSIYPQTEQGMCPCLSSALDESVIYFFLHPSFSIVCVCVCVFFKVYVCVSLFMDICEFF